MEVFHADTYAEMQQLSAKNGDVCHVDRFGLFMVMDLNLLPSDYGVMQDYVSPSSQVIRAKHKSYFPPQKVGGGKIKRW